GDDVGIHGAVAIAAGDGAAAVGRADEAVVDHSAGARSNAAFVKAEVVGGGGSVVDAAVSDVDHEIRSGELRLREALGCKPWEIAGTAGKIAEKMSGGDLSLPFVGHFGGVVKLNRDDIGPGRELFEMTWRDA